MRRANAVAVKTLYHYQLLSREYLTDTLRKNRVHFSNPAYFNDPWDCSPLYSAAGLEDGSCRGRWTEFFGQLTHTLPEVNRRVVEERSLLRDPSFLARTMRT